MLEFYVQGFQFLNVFFFVRLGIVEGDAEGVYVAGGGVVLFYFLFGYVVSDFGFVGLYFVWFVYRFF